MLTYYLIMETDLKTKMIILAKKNVMILWIPL